MSVYIPTVQTVMFRGDRSRSQSRAIRGARWLAATVITVSFAFAAMRGAAGKASLRVDQVRPVSGAAILKSDGLHVQRGHGYVVVTGSVVNTSHRTIRHAEAVLELRDSSGRTRSVAPAMVMFGAIEPGGDSPFRVIAEDFDGARSARIRFRTTTGVPLPAEVNQ